MKRPLVVTVLGTRPEITKLSPLLPLLDKRCRHVLVHTGQHYDPALDAVFFRELKLRKPDHNLRVGSGSSTHQLGLMLERLDTLFKKLRPHTVLVLGDTNSTLAGAIAAVKSGAKLVHIEAGCRSFRLDSPEEQNRRMVDHIADLHFAPDLLAAKNLQAEGIWRSVYLSGSTALEASTRMLKLLEHKRRLPARALATLHRAENTGDKATLAKKLKLLGLAARSCPVVFPLHPRTKKQLRLWKLPLPAGVLAVPPLGYGSFLYLLKHAPFVLTDSGGVQEEAAVARVPCLVLREETEWLRYVKEGRNFLVGESEQKLKAALKKVPKAKRSKLQIPKSAEKIFRVLKKKRLI
ncbi:MAG TPA: UDP-N-acetylglucosamine 2-epimerase (non-hydrolyzing) [Bdellovibrionota bacterium]|jgi:UDP-N-acetylglucosamine 2-epimerase (non-hydrolysing)